MYLVLSVYDTFAFYLIICMYVGAQPLFFLEDSFFSHSDDVDKYLYGYDSYKYPHVFMYHRSFSTYDIRLGERGRGVGTFKLLKKKKRVYSTN